MTQPSTRWAFPQPWQIEALPPASQARAPEVSASRAQNEILVKPDDCVPTVNPDASRRAPNARDNDGALLSLLARDLDRGYKYVAARHLMMLESQSLPVPPAVRARCDALTATCSPQRLAVIRQQVEDWVVSMRLARTPPCRDL